LDLDAIAALSCRQLDGRSSTRKMRSPRARWRSETPETATGASYAAVRPHRPRRGLSRADRQVKAIEIKFATPFKTDRLQGLRRFRTLAHAPVGG